MITEKARYEARHIAPNGGAMRSVLLAETIN